MSNRPRWIVALALLVGAAGLFAAIRFLPDAQAGRPSAPPGLAACGSRPGIGPGATPRPGAFYRLQPHLDSRGTLVGQQLYVGADGLTRGFAELGAESSASGPVDGVIAVVTDDAHQSSVRLVVAEQGCATTIHTTASVVRRALIDPVDGSVLIHLLDRTSRADLGIWRLAAGGSQPTRIVEPLPAALGLGPVWATDLRLDSAGRLLAVQSCLDRACVTRIVDLGGLSRPPIVIRGDRQGPLIGFAGDRLLTWAACDGNPCDVLVWDAADAGPAVLVADAVGAGITGDGSLLVAVTAGDQGEHASVVDLATSQARPLRGLAAGDRPIAVGAVATMGFEVAPDAIAMAQPAGNPHAVRPSAAGEVLP